MFLYIFCSIVCGFGVLRYIAICHLTTMCLLHVGGLKWKHNFPPPSVSKWYYC